MPSGTVTSETNFALSVQPDSFVGSGVDAMGVSAKVEIAVGQPGAVVSVDTVREFCCVVLV